MKLILFFKNIIMNINLWEIYTKSWDILFTRWLKVILTFFISFLLFYFFWLEKVENWIIVNIISIIPMFLLIYESMIIFNPDIKITIKKFINVVLAIFILAILYFVWFACFIIPWVYILLKTVYTVHFILEDDVWPIEGITKSWKLVGNKWDLIFFNKLIELSLIFALILFSIAVIYPLSNILWGVLLYLWTIATVPYITIVETKIYYELKNNNN